MNKKMKKWADIGFFAILAVLVTVGGIVRIILQIAGVDDSISASVASILLIVMIIAYSVCLRIYWRCSKCQGKHTPVRRIVSARERTRFPQKTYAT